VVDATVVVTLASVVEVLRVDRRTEDVVLTTVVDVTMAVDGKTDVKVRILVDARAVRVSVTVLVITTVAWTISVADTTFVEVATTTEGSGSGMLSLHSPRPS